MFPFLKQREALGVFISVQSDGVHRKQPLVTGRSQAIVRKCFIFYFSLKLKFATTFQCPDGVMVSVSDSKSRVHGFEPDPAKFFLNYNYLFKIIIVMFYFMSLYLHNFDFNYIKQ